MSSQISMNTILLNASRSNELNLSRQTEPSNNQSFENSFGPQSSTSTLNTSPQNGLGDINARNVQPSSVNISDNSMICPSPDEIVIKGRGRRSLPVKWSPIPIESPKKLPPISSINFNKSPKKGLITLRASPRKRLQLNDPSAGELVNSRKALINNSPLFKKPTGLQSPLQKVASSPETIVNKLSQKQLANILTTVMKNHPDIKDEVGKIIPEPILKIAEEQISEIHKSIIQATDSKTDYGSFCRVMPHLSAMKKVISEQCQHLSATEQWHSLLEFVFYAWFYVRETPLWDSEVHLNYARNPCFKILAQHCLQALQNIDLKDSKEIEYICERLESLSVDHKDVMSSLEFVKELQDL